MMLVFNKNKNISGFFRIDFSGGRGLTDNCTSTNTFTGETGSYFI